MLTRRFWITLLVVIVAALALAGQAAFWWRVHHPSDMQGWIVK